ncbi:EamA family transporter [Pseudobdellovibrio exovorus]|uniref:EamA domain-containing protein n=1 Tax=Pseudobdellovibrio exovorus JSS TaxID=1184267 RepID=M4VDY6_9BACT|nr:EamA family transporter [Pseudobdellovibrio exovorus]AGH96705.1 hypothetical protein A11Q_2489 [Pseudobdellovibrio exovorus JSS]
MRLSFNSASSKTLILCFAAVYIIWGSTYFAIVYAIQSIPPWSMSSGRFFIAGLLMLGLSLLKKEKPLSRHENIYASISGLFLIFANGIVCVAEQTVSSGIVAVIVGAMPIWIMLLGWVAFSQARPTLQKMVGSLIGLSGVVLIATDSVSTSTSSVGSSSMGMLLLMGSSFAWATGTLLQRKVTAIQSPVRFAGLQMFVGAVGAFVMAVIFEKPWQISWASVTVTSWLATLYLVVFGSMVAFTAYSWLARNVEPHLVSTYALVNPVIAVWLGWFFLKEPLSSRFFLATILVLVGLSLLLFHNHLRKVFSDLFRNVFQSVMKNPVKK